ncbi:MAG TPA: methyltransferase domain-containing protein [Gemmatimonadaceae bacterium]|nr:methyltransferase domain-containing protein [Gemmatimonadaceae bacterium]
MIAVTPRPRRGREYLDDAEQMDALVVRRSLGDVARANALFGGTRAVIAELRRALRRAPAGRPLTVLDVGTGRGDIPAAATAWWHRRGVHLETIGIEQSEMLARIASEQTIAVSADALQLPLADRSVDIAMCSQVLHHFERADAMAVLREVHRVARLRVIVSDLHRSWFAAAGIWLASFPLVFHPVSRHDGVLSVLRGFTRRELGELVELAVGQQADVRYRLGFRVTASWTPASRGS